MFGKKEVAARAKIIADQGCYVTQKSRNSTLWYQTYIVEVYPETEPPFRAEVKGWVCWLDKPEEGTEVQVLYVPGTKKVKLDLEGDPRFDWKLRQANEKAGKAARREELLNAPEAEDPGSDEPPIRATNVSDAIDELLERHQRREISDDELWEAQNRFLNEMQ